ncbi:MAG: zinc ribbon domain-containing protein [Candidatus Helarchaeota archaeon]
MEKIISIMVMPRINLRGIFDLVPIVKKHIEGFPDNINIHIPSNIVEKSKDVYLFLRIFNKIDQHFKILLEMCYDIYIIADNDLTILNSKYLEFWKSRADLIPPERRRYVEKILLEWLKKEGKEVISDESDLEFFIKYYRMSLENLDWSRKKKLWKELRKEGRENNLDDEKKNKQLIYFKKTWNKYNHKIHLPNSIAIHIRENLIPKERVKVPPRKTTEVKYEKMKFCPMCGAEGGTNFCANCGYDLRLEKKFCPNCGVEIDRESIVYCPNCGYKL